MANMLQLLGKISVRIVVNGLEILILFCIKKIGYNFFMYVIKFDDKTYLYSSCGSTDDIEKAKTYISERGANEKIKLLKYYAKIHDFLHNEVYEKSSTARVVKVVVLELDNYKYLSKGLFL